MKKVFSAFLFTLLSVAHVSTFAAETGDGARPQTHCTAEDQAKDGELCIELSEHIGNHGVVRGKNGIDLLGNYIYIFYKYAASIIGIICVLIIIGSGIQIMAGGANSENVNEGKERIFTALMSLGLLLGSALILKTVNPGFFI